MGISYLLAVVLGPEDTRYNLCHGGLLSVWGKKENTEQTTLPPVKATTHKDRVLCPSFSCVYGLYYQTVCGVLDNRTVSYIYFSLSFAQSRDHIMID